MGAEIKPSVPDKSARDLIEIYSKGDRGRGGMGVGGIGVGVGWGWGGIGVGVGWGCMGADCNQV